jgi:hypothetical protein
MTENVFEMKPGIRIDPNSWNNPELHYLGTGRTAPKPFPLTVLPEFWSKWCFQQAQARSAPVDYVACALLAGTAGIIVNRRWVRATPEWAEPTLLWHSSVGQPAAGKSPGQKAVTKMIEAIDITAQNAAKPFLEKYLKELNRTQMAEEIWRAQAKQAMKEGKPEPPFPAAANPPPEVVLPRAIVQDTTTEALGSILTKQLGGVLMYNDELSGWWGNMSRYSNGTDRPVWLKAYDGASVIIDRVRHPVPYIIPRFSVGVLGGVQPDKVAELLKGSDDGLIARILWAYPEPIQGITTFNGAIDNEVRMKALRRIFQLEMEVDMVGNVFPVGLKLAQEASDSFLAFRLRNKSRQLKSYGMIANSINKNDGHVLRLASVLAHLEWAPNEDEPPPEYIYRRHIEGAITLVERYFQPHAERVLTESSVPSEDSAAGKLVKWIRKENKQTFNAREVRRIVFGGAVKDAEIMENACQHLVDAGLVRVLESRPGKRGGRRAINYETNPAIWNDTPQ